MEEQDIQQLIIDAKLGNQDAKSELLRANSPLVKSVIRRFKNKGIEYDDLYQLGCIGFLKAIRNFMPQFGVKFSTYAVPMIAGEIKRFLRDDGLIKVSRATKSLSIKINRFIEDYKKTNGYSPTIDTLSNAIGVEQQEIVFAMDSGKLPISIYEQQPDDNNKSQNILDKLSYDDNELQLTQIVLKQLISSLDIREKKVVLLRYYRDYTQAQAAKQLGISQVQVSRIESRLIQKLKDQLEKH